MSKKYFGQTNNSAEAVVPQADKLATPRDITLAGDVTGGITFDGASNETITTVLDIENVIKPVLDDALIYMRTEADLEAMKAQNNELYAASGFVVYEFMQVVQL